jgi:hypothetical protein
MSNKNWRNSLDLVVEQNLNELISETKEYDSAVSSAKDKSKAQIWVALAIVNKKLNDLSIGVTGKSKSKIPKSEMDEILRTLETL